MSQRGGSKLLSWETTRNKSESTLAEVAFCLLLSLLSLQQIIKTATTFTQHCKVPVNTERGTLRGYSLLMMRKALVDDSVWEIDGGENRRGKEAGWHCFPLLHSNKTNTSTPPRVHSMSAGGYDRSSDRSSVLCCCKCA